MYFFELWFSQYICPVMEFLGHVCVCVCVCVCVLSHFRYVWLCVIHGPKPARLLCPWDSPDKNTGVGCQAFLWGSSYPGIKPMLLMSPALAGSFFTTSAIWEAMVALFLVFKATSILFSIVTISVFRIDHILGHKCRRDAIIIISLLEIMNLRHECPSQ